MLKANGRREAFCMEAENWLSLFLETGAPEYYLLYKEAVRERLPVTI